MIISLLLFFNAVLRILFFNNLITSTYNLDLELSILIKNHFEKNLDFSFIIKAKQLD